MARSGSSGDFTLEKGLPSNPEAERAILGAILLDNGMINAAAERLRREDFFLDSHRRIYEQMLHLYETGRAIDPITLQDALRRSGELELVGGPAYIASLFDGVPRFANIDNYTKIVKDKSILRRLITASNQIMATCFDDEEEAEIILDNAERSILAIGEERIKQGFVPISEVARKQLEYIEEIAGRKQLITGVATGFGDLDYLTSGLQRGDLIIIAARPSMGKTAFCLNIAQNAATRPQFDGRKAVVGIFSLEMSKEQLVHRLLCSQARIDAHRLRSGMLGKEDWKKLAYAVSELAEARIFLDDTPGINVLEMRAKARRLKNEQKTLDLLIVDYLQLMSGRGRNESRQQEVSQISRELKILAKELDVPLIALSQLSRAPEARTGNRPQLSDLRESGCLAGESLVTLADTGERIPIGELAGKSGFKVWALNENTMRVEAATVSRAFSTGIKPVFRLTTRLGRSIRATANHKFRALEGWRRLDELRPGERVAVPRRLPSPTAQTMSDAELALLGHLIGDGCTLPRHAVQYTTRESDLAETVADLARQVLGFGVEPRIRRECTWYQVYLSSTRHHTHGVRSRIAEWLDDLGAWGLRSHEKRIPDRVFMQPAEAIGVFLRHLWATDGCIKYLGVVHYPSVYYATSSPDLADGVQTLLLRLGINATISRHAQKGKGRDQYHVTVSGKPDLECFISLVGAVGAHRSAHLAQISESLRASREKTNRDVIPRDVWPLLTLPSLGGNRLSSMLRGEIFGSRSSLNILQRRNLTRERAGRIANTLKLRALSILASSEVYWDEILSIEPDGEAKTFDLTVDNLHNFEACNSFAHNSIEQDADIVMFIYREDVYKPDTDKQNIAEIIIGKQRNGPTGSVELVFLKQLTRFEDKFRE